MTAKPGDPYFVPRHPPIDLAIVRRRVAERRAQARGLTALTRSVVEADTDMIEELASAVASLRIAIAVLKGEPTPRDI